jgi:hypothetical protein
VASHFQKILFNRYKSSDELPRALARGLQIIKQSLALAKFFFGLKSFVFGFTLYPQLKRRGYSRSYSNQLFFKRLLIYNVY